MSASRVGCFGFRVREMIRALQEHVGAVELAETTQRGTILNLLETPVRSLEQAVEQLVSATRAGQAQMVYLEGLERAQSLTAALRGVADVLGTQPVPIDTLLQHVVSHAADQDKAFWAQTSPNGLAGLLRHDVTLQGNLSRAGVAVFEYQECGSWRVVRRPSAPAPANTLQESGLPVQTSAAAARKGRQ